MDPLGKPSIAGVEKGLGGAPDGEEERKLRDVGGYLLLLCQKHVLLTPGSTLGATESNLTCQLFTMAKVCVENRKYFAAPESCSIHRELCLN